MLGVHTGMGWFDVTVYVTSGLAAIRLAWLLPRYAKMRYALVRMQIQAWLEDRFGA